MPTFTLVITAANGHQYVALSEFPEKTTAIKDAAGVLTPDHPITPRA